MAIAMQRFCINRKIAPALSIEAFFRLVNRLGLNKVELRNDLPSGKVTDDLSHQQVRELAARYHIEILTINAVYPFNRRSEEVRQLTESLLKEAQAIGAKSLVLCPLNDGSEVPASETLGALRDLAPLFAFYGIHGLVEPLGFPQSSLRSAHQAQTLIHDALGLEGPHGLAHGGPADLEHLGQLPLRGQGVADREAAVEDPGVDPLEHDLVGLEARRAPVGGGSVRHEHRMARPGSRRTDGRTIHERDWSDH